MATDKPPGRTLIAIRLARSDILLATSLPLFFFMPSVASLLILAFPAGLPLARWQYGTEPWEMRRRAAMTALFFLAGRCTLFLLLIVVGRTRPGFVEVDAALMFLAV